MPLSSDSSSFGYPGIGRAPDLAEQIRRSLSLNASFRRVWEVCIEFVRGNQDSMFATTGIVNSDTSTTAGRLWQSDNVVLNKILPVRNNIASRLVTAYPAMTVLPASDSLDDMSKMKASQLALRYYWNRDNVKEKLKEGTLWLVDTGNYGLHEYFDPVTKEVVTEVVSPFDLAYEGYINGSKKSEWVMIRRYTTIQAIRDRFPQEAAEIDAHASTGASPDSYRQWGPQAHPTDRIECWEVYTVDGRHRMMLGSYILWEGRTQTTRMPAQHVRFTEISGYLQGMGVVETCIPSQVLRNKIETQILKNAYYMGNLKIARPIAAGIEAGAFAADAGEIVDYEGSQPPTYMQPPPMPQYIVELPSRLDADMNDCAGMAAVTQGKISGTNSGTQAEVLTANSLSTLTLVQDNIESAVTEMASCVLQLMKANYDEAKMIRMLDTDGSFVFQELQATDLVDDPEIFLEAGTLFRSSAQDRDNDTLKQLKAGIIKPDDAKLALSVHTVSNDMVEQMKAAKHAKDLLGACVQFNKPVEINPADDVVDLQALKAAFKEFMHSPNFYRLPLAKQDMIDSCYAHIGLALKAKIAEEAGLPPQPPGPDANGSSPPPNAGQTAAGVPMGQDGQIAAQQAAAKFETPPPLGQPTMGGQ